MISIIMPTYNKCRFLELTLTGFTIQSYKDFEIVIVDDGSTDKTEEIVNSFLNRLNIKYVYQENQGRAIARNKALKLATGDYLIFCDDDRIPSRNFLNEHLKILKDKIVTIGNKKEIMSILRKTDTYLPSYFFDLCKKNSHIFEAEYYKEDIQLFTTFELEANFEKVVNEYGRLEPADNFRIVYQKYDEVLNGFYFGWILGTTANLGVSRDALEKVKFDEKYNGWGMEDTDFSYELYKAGYNFVLAKNAVNYHQYHNKDVNYISTLKENMNYFYNKNKELDAALFLLLMRTRLSVVDINDIFIEINKRPTDTLCKAYKDLLHLTISNLSSTNKEYLS